MPILVTALPLIDKSITTVSNYSYTLFTLKIANAKANANAFIGKNIERMR